MPQGGRDTALSHRLVGWYVTKAKRRTLYIGSSTYGIVLVLGCLDRLGRDRTLDTDPLVILTIYGGLSLSTLIHCWYI